MELVRADTQRAYEVLRDKIVTLDLPPGSLINEQALTESLGLGPVPIREALQLLAHDNLVSITARHGLYVADVSVPDLAQISELRLTLEVLCARLAAQRRTADDLVVLEALRHEQSAAGVEDAAHLLDLDHRFHRAVAQAAHNRYLTQTLDLFFGLSQRLWYLALPRLQFLPASVEKHLDLVDAVREHDADRAEQIMRSHVQEFYDRVYDMLTG